MRIFGNFRYWPGAGVCLNFSNVLEMVRNEEISRVADQRSKNYQNRFRNKKVTTVWSWRFSVIYFFLIFQIRVTTWKTVIWASGSNPGSWMFWRTFFCCVPKSLWNHQKSKVWVRADRYWCPKKILTPSEQKVSAVWIQGRLWAHKGIWRRNPYFFNDKISNGSNFLLRWS